MMDKYIYLLFSLLFTVYGQLIIKFRLTKHGVLSGNFFEKISFMLKLFLDPLILSGFLAAFFAALFWMAAMMKFKLSYAYPIYAACLIMLTTFLAIIMLKESITIKQIAGIILLLLGVLLLGKA